MSGEPYVVHIGDGLNAGVASIATRCRTRAAACRAAAALVRDGQRMTEVRLRYRLLDTFVRRGTRAYHIFAERQRSAPASAQQEPLL